jgi:hypothetical protein
MGKSLDLILSNTHTHMQKHKSRKKNQFRMVEVRIMITFVAGFEWKRT